MTLLDFYRELSSLYPEALSCPWDNDGIMCSADTSKEVSRVLVCLDATDDAISYAAENGFDTVLCHHPMIFKGVKSVTDGNVMGGSIITCIKNGISVISLHTRLDAGEGGVNDCLANALGLTDIVPFGDEESPTLGRIGSTDETTAESFAEKVKASLGVKAVNLYSGGKVSKVAVCGGSGKDFVFPALRAGADAIVLGECSYNVALDAASEGLTVIEAGHYYTEITVLERLAELAKNIAGAETELYSLKRFMQI